MPEQKIMWTNKQGEWFDTYEEALRSERNHEREQILNELNALISQSASEPSEVVVDYIMQNFERESNEQI